MTTRPNAPPALEPSPEAVKAARDRLREKGVTVSEDVVRDALRGVLAIEAARIERRSREAAAACLLKIQDTTREALALLAQPNAPTAPLSAVSPASAAATSAGHTGEPRRDRAATPGGRSPRGRHFQAAVRAANAGPFPFTRASPAGFQGTPQALSPRCPPGHLLLAGPQ
jgi:hypothetical protein